MSPLNNEYQSMVANGIIFEASQAAEAWKQAAYDLSRPSIVWKPKLSKDGNMWCFLYGDDLMTGVAGFGETPEKASYAFDAAWCKP